MIEFFRGTFIISFISYLPMLMHIARMFQFEDLEILMKRVF